MAKISPWLKRVKKKTLTNRVSQRDKDLKNQLQLLSAPTNF